MMCYKSDNVVGGTLCERVLPKKLIFRLVYFILNLTKKITDTDIQKRYNQCTKILLYHQSGLCFSLLIPVGTLLLTVSRPDSLTEWLRWVKCS